MSKVSPDLCFPCLWDISLVQVFISLANQHSHITHCFSSLPDLPLSNYFSYSDSVAWKILQDQALPYISILSFAQPPSPLPAHHPLYMSHMCELPCGGNCFALSQPWQTLPLTLQHSAQKFSLLYHSWIPPDRFNGCYTVLSDSYCTSITEHFKLWGDCMFVSPALCSFMWWSVKCGHEKRHKRGSRKQNFLYLQVLETGGTSHHTGSRGKG